jgi:bifunctional UDP-N-acetylglucosamine pyrophosphorylase/glucosamine-1-phosphate N-acetyltransferase
VEQRDAAPEVAAINEVNSGLYAFDCRALLESLGHLRPDNKQKELYLTDCAEIIKNSGKKVAALPVLDADEMQGVNTREQLETVTRIMQRRTGKKLVGG